MGMGMGMATLSCARELSTSKTRRHHVTDGLKVLEYLSTRQLVAGSGGCQLEAPSHHVNSCQLLADINWSSVGPSARFDQVTRCPSLTY